MPRKASKNALAEAPELIADKRVLCKIQGAPRGSNVFEAFTGEESYLVQLPNRFRKSLWIKPGSFVIVELLDPSSKVRGEIIHVLLSDEVKERRKGASWPQSLDATLSPTEDDGHSVTSEPTISEPQSEITDQHGEGESTDDDDLWQNTNRR